MTRTEKWRTVGKITAMLAPIGALVGLIPGLFLGDDGPRSVVAGAVIGFLISAGMVAFEVAWGVGLVPRRWREASFLFVLVTRSLVWLTIIVVGIAVPLLLVEDVAISELPTATIGWSIVVSFLAALLINFIGQVNRLLGSGVLVRLILGRYHDAREESRIFLLVDMRGSTQIAERLGNLPYHAFLRRFIADVSTGALRHGGEVHRYVGDEVILTWKEENGLRDAACVRAVFAIADTLDAESGTYLEEFGIVPRFWAGLHLGSVVTGEVGTVKHEIVYLGDTLNTSARIEQACREFQRTFLASADVVDALELPSEVSAESLGAIELRGKRSSVELVALTRAEVCRSTSA